MRHSPALLSGRTVAMNGGNERFAVNGKLEAFAATAGWAMGHHGDPCSIGALIKFTEKNN